MKMFLFHLKQVKHQTGKLDMVQFFSKILIFFKVFRNYIHTYFNLQQQKKDESAQNLS